MSVPDELRSCTRRAAPGAPIAVISALGWLVGWLALSVPVLAQPAPFCAGGQSPTWLDAFVPLRDRLGDAMGEPIECPHAATEGGDTLQQTTTGLAALRQPLGIPTFTDGVTHWALTDAGLVDWTGPSPDPPRPAPPCATLPIRGFGQVYGARAEPFSLLGCPTAAESTLDVSSQRFEHGWMLWRARRGPGHPPTIFVLFEDAQRYLRLDDTSAASVDPDSGTSVPPAGLFEPTGGIGNVWRQATALGVRERLGWAIEPEVDGLGAIETFERGFMLWAPGPRHIYLLASTTADRPQQVLQTWREYPDTFVE